MTTLRFTNWHREQFYLANLGLPWPKRPELRLIERTTTDRSQAKEFATMEDARACLVTVGSPRMRPLDGDERWGWEIVEG